MPTTEITGGVGPRLCDFIRGHRAQILAGWEARLSALPAAQHMDERALRDHVPLLLEALADFVAAPPSAEEDLEALPSIHALGRLDAGYDLRQLTQEYWFLRDAIVDLWIQVVGPLIDAAEVRRLNLAIERLLGRSIASFVQARERTLRALDRVSSAALGTGDLDQFLPELLTALLEATPAVDAAAVLLFDRGALRVRAAAGIDPPLVQQVAPEAGAGPVHEVVGTRRPLLVRDVASDPRLSGTQLRQSGLHALYCVPLVHHGEVVGVACVGSRTAFDFAPQDRLVCEAMVHRATSLIVQAQLRAELRRSQQLLQAVVDHAPSAIYLKDRDGAYVLTNRATEEALGRPREQVRGSTDAQLFAPQAAERIRASDLQVLQRRAPIELEESLQTGGQTRTWLTFKFPLPGENGDPWAIGGISTDITERQQAQRAREALLHETEQSRQSAERALSALDAVLAAAPVGILFIDRELIVRRANREMATMAGGLLPEQMEGKRASELLAAADALEGERTVGRVIDTGIPVRGKIHSLRLLGQQQAPERHLLQNIEPVRGAGGEVVGAVLAMVDVTEQVLANQRLREALAERQRIADVFERGDACVVTDRDLNVVLVNRNQELLSNTRREQTLGRFLWEIFPEAADETSAFSREIERVMLERVETQFEEYFAPLDRWFEVHAYPVPEGGIAIYFSDVSDRKRTEQFEERLVGIVSHDLRNPLATITLSAQSLQHRQAELPPFAATAAGRISRSAERMTDMIGQLLDFTRARLGGGIALERRRVDLCEVASAVCEELALVHPGRVGLECDGPVEGEWDPQRLAQVLSNLVSNGLKHGAPEAPVSVRVGCCGAECWVAVHNQGAPIPPEKVQALFDPFKRGETQERSGLGLGLYIARQIVLAHGGRIEVSSGAGEGTCFTVWLPI